MVPPQGFWSSPFLPLCSALFFRDECKSQVDKFPAASFKKFGSEPEAWAFVRGEDPSAVPGNPKYMNVQMCSIVPAVTSEIIH